MPVLRPAARRLTGAADVLLWFLGTAVMAVWFVFRDPGFDHRLLLVGALLPELDGFFGGARVMHTLVFAVALLVGIMLATAGRRPVRRVLLPLSIGVLLHLVVDGVWTDTAVFWWPFGGWGFDDAALPAARRGWWNLPLEVAGLALLAWRWRIAGLADPVLRRQFLFDGRLAP